MFISIDKLLSTVELQLFLVEKRLIYLTIICVQWTVIYVNGYKAIFDISILTKCSFVL